MELVRIEVPWKPLYLAPLGDIQWSGDKKEVAFEQLKRHIGEAMELGAWFIGMGDYIDYASPSNRDSIRSAKLYDTTRKVMEDRAKELNEELYRLLLKPTVGRWIGLLEGHHFYEYKSGITSDMELAEMLGTRHLGTRTLVDVTFARPQYGKGHTQSTRGIQVWAQHGAGGGQTIQAPLVKLSQLAAEWEGVDIFLMGHMTKIATAPTPRIRGNFRARPYRLEHRDARLVGTGGWLKGMVEGRRDGQVPRGGYVEQGAMRAVTLGAPIVRVIPQLLVVDGHEQVWAPDIKAIA